jgi:HEAT repeat protein
MTAYCPRCWTEVSPEARVCPACGADLGEEIGDYLAKLIAALHHPEPLTQRRAAYILGLLRNPDAVEALVAVLVSAADPYVRGEAARALGAIGGEQAWTVLRQIAGDEAQSVIVRRAAAEALRGRLAIEGARTIAD